MDVLHPAERRLQESGITMIREESEDKAMTLREFKVLADLAERLTEAGYSECSFSDFEYYPIMTAEFPEVRKLTDTEEDIVMGIMERLIG